MRRCEYIEKKTPTKNILKFLKHFSSRSHHKLYFGPPCIHSVSSSISYKFPSRSPKINLDNSYTGRSKRKVYDIVCSLNQLINWILLIWYIFFLYLYTDYSFLADIPSKLLGKKWIFLNFVKSSPLIAWLERLRGTKSSQRGWHEWLCELIDNYFVNNFINFFISNLVFI